MSNTVQVPVKWLEELMEKAKLTSILDSANFQRLKGYIESAEVFLEEGEDG